MRKLLFILLFLPFLGWGQEYQFEFFFEDTLGNKDTLVLGLDTNASYLFDTAMGEINIGPIPWDTVFEVRFLYAPFNYPGDSVSSKKLVTEIFDPINPLCSFGATIGIVAHHWPIKLSWDSTNFHGCNNDAMIITNDQLKVGDVGCGFADSLVETDLRYSSTFDLTAGLPIANLCVFNHYEQHYPQNLKTYIITSHLHTNIRELQNESDSKPYPNPTTTNLNIQFPNLNQNPFELSIFDNLGKLIYRREDISEGQLQLDVSAYPSGLYHYQLLNPQSRQKSFGKFVKR